ncbi:MAG: methyltransferase [Pseudomonadales bacterium]|nr:methyltransferase [Pseudomonadales bacterium]
MKKYAGAPDSATLARWRQDIIIEADIDGSSLSLVSTWGLFSPEAIDEGSRLLLRYLDIERTDDVLDLGCGYGVLGLTLAKRAPEGQTLMVDKDFVAVDYARRNITRNHLSNAEAQLSNGLQNIDPTRLFDHVVCNLPAKASKEQHYLFLVDAHARLKPGGRMTLVTINGLREFMARTLHEVFGNHEKLKQGSTYTVTAGVKTHPLPPGRAI